MYSVWFEKEGTWNLDLAIGVSISLFFVVKYKAMPQSSRRKRLGHFMFAAGMKQIKLLFYYGQSDWWDTDCFLSLYVGRQLRKCNWGFVYLSWDLLLNLELCVRTLNSHIRACVI